MITSSTIGTFLGTGKDISTPSSLPQRLQYNEALSSGFTILNGDGASFTYRIAPNIFHDAFMAIIEGGWERLLICLALKGDFDKLASTERYDKFCGNQSSYEFYCPWEEGLPYGYGWWEDSTLLRDYFVKPQYGRYNFYQFEHIASLAIQVNQLLKQRISARSIEKTTQTKASDGTKSSTTTQYGYACSPFMIIGEWENANWSRKTPESVDLLPIITFESCKDQDGCVEVLKETIPYAPSINTTFSTKDKYWKYANTGIIENATKSEIDKIINVLFGWDIATCCGYETFEAITNRIAKQKAAAENAYKTACEEALKKQTEDNKVAQTNYEEKEKEENERYDAAIAKIDEDYAEYLGSLNPEKVVPAREEYEKTVEQAEKEYTEAEKKAKKIKVDANNEITETRETKVENAKSKLDKEDITIDEYKSLINDIYAEWLEGYEANNKTYDEACEMAKQSQNEKETAALEKYQAVLKEVEKLKEDEAKKVEDKKKAESEQHETNLTEAKEELTQKETTYQSVYEAAIASAKQTYDAAIKAYDSELKSAKYQTGNNEIKRDGYPYNTDGMPIDIWYEGQPSDYDISTNAKYAAKDNVADFKKSLWINFLRAAFTGDETMIECLSAGGDEKIRGELSDYVCYPFIVFQPEVYSAFVRFVGNVLPIATAVLGRFAPFGVFAIYNSYSLTKENATESSGAETIAMYRMSYRHRNIARTYYISIGFSVDGEDMSKDSGYSIGYTLSYSIGEDVDWVDEEAYRSNQVNFAYSESLVKTVVFPIDRVVDINIDKLMGNCLAAYKGEEGGNSGIDNVEAVVFKNMSSIVSIQLPDEIKKQHEANVDEKYNEALAEKEQEYQDKCREYEKKLSDMQDEHKKRISGLEGDKYRAGLDCKSYYYGSGILPIYKSFLPDDFTIPGPRVDVDSFNEACSELDSYIANDKAIIDGTVSSTDTEKELATTRYNEAQNVLSDYAKGLKSSDKYYDNLITQAKAECDAEEAELEEEYSNYKEEYEAWVAQQNKQKEEDAKDGNYADVIAIKMNKFLVGIAGLQSTTVGYNSGLEYLWDVHYIKNTSEAQRLSAKFEATFPCGNYGGPSSNECLVDCTGFDYYPIDCAIKDGYTDNPKLHSFWSGDAQIGGISSKTRYAIYKSDFYLGETGSNNEDIIRSNHIGGAANGVMGLLQGAVAGMYSTAGGESELVFDAEGIKGRINQYAVHLPSEEEVKSAIEGAISEANWTCDDNLYLFVALDVTAGDPTISEKTGESAISIGIGTKEDTNNITWYAQTETKASVRQSPIGIPDCISVKEGFNQAAPWKANAYFKGFVGTFDWNWKALVYND